MRAVEEADREGPVAEVHDHPADGLRVLLGRGGEDGEEVAVADAALVDVRLFGAAGPEQREDAEISPGHVGRLGSRIGQVGAVEDFVDGGEGVPAVVAQTLERGDLVNVPERGLVRRDVGQHVVGVHPVVVPLRPARERVGPAADADQDVLPVVAEQLIAPRTAVERVPPRAAVQLVVAGLPLEDVVTVEAVEAVGAVAAREVVVTAIAVQDVVSVVSEQGVVSAAAREVVVAVASVGHTRDRGPVGEAVVAAPTLEEDGPECARRVALPEETPVRGHGDRVGAVDRHDVAVVGSDDAEGAQLDGDRRALNGRRGHLAGDDRPDLDLVGLARARRVSGAAHAGGAQGRGQGRQAVEQRSRSS